MVDTATSLTPLLNTEQAAQFCGVKPNTMAKWRVAGCGPQYLKMGKSIYYEQSAIAEFKAANTYNSTTQYGVV